LFQIARGALQAKGLCERKIGNRFFKGPKRAFQRPTALLATPIASQWLFAAQRDEAGFKRVMRARRPHRFSIALLLDHGTTRVVHRDVIAVDELKRCISRLGERRARFARQRANEKGDPIGAALYHFKPPRD
jgi:hypothetical protein